MVKEKPGFLTAKATANRIKSKGLQKLRWYCQMCQKQCRDENGFKCHISSESHHRQMLLFDQNSNHFLGNNTRIFMKGYLDVLRRQFGGKRTKANVIYQEYIKDKEHIHMNSTKFTTLTGFINCLHKMGICRVDENDKGWFIEYVAKDPEAEQSERKKRRLDKTMTQDDDQFFEMIEKHLCKKPRLEKEANLEPTELMKTEDEKIVFNFFAKAEPKLEFKPPAPIVINGDVKENIRSISVVHDKPSVKLSFKPEAVSCDNSKKNERQRSESLKPPTPVVAKKLSTLEEMKLEQERNKERKSRTRYWLHEGIIVKLVDKSLPETLLNKNVVVQKMENHFCAIVKTVDAMPKSEGGQRKKMRVQQEHVITVIPKTGGSVLVVNGAYRECRGRLLSIDRNRCSGNIELTSGIHTGMKLADVSYDDFSQLYTDE